MWHRERVRERGREREKKREGKGWRGIVKKKDNGKVGNRAREGERIDTKVGKYSSACLGFRKIKGM